LPAPLRIVIEADDQPADHIPKTSNKMSGRLYRRRLFRLQRLRTSAIAIDRFLRSGLRETATLPGRQQRERVQRLYQR
jgi:hypothetical protein